MYDIEFLQAQDPRLSEHVIYVYQPNSAALRSRVRRRVQGQLEAQGCTFMGLGSDEVAHVNERLAPKISFTSLFDDPCVVCDLAILKGRPNWQADIDEVLDLIAGGGVNRTFLMVPADSYATRCSGWREAARAATLIEEPLVSAATVKLILDFLLADTNLFDFSQLNDKGAFRTHLEAAVSRRSQTLLEFVQIFDAVTLTQIDQETGRFSPGAYWEEGVQGEPPALLHQLNAFLATRDGWHLKHLVLFADDRINRRRTQPEALMAQLYGATATLLAKTQQPLALRASEQIREREVSKGADPKAEDLAFWAALLLGYEEQIRCGAPLVAFDKLCRTYRRASLLPLAERTLDGLWGKIAQHLVMKGGSVRLTKARDRTVGELQKYFAAATADPPASWYTRLKMTVARAIESGDHASTLCLGATSII
jgi:hypothetical protein